MPGWPSSSGGGSWQLLVAVTAAACTLTSAVVYYAASAHHQSQSIKRENKKVSRRPQNDDQQDEAKPSRTMTKEPVVYLNNAAACYDYIVGKDADADEFDEVKVVAKAICPEWANANVDDITVKIICGGITNRLFRLLWQDKSVLVRLYGDNTEAFIDRSVENMLFALLSKQGFAPTYHGRFTNGRIEGWMDARPLEPQELGLWAPVNFLNLVGREIGHMHNIEAPLDRTPVLWTKIDQFERLALEISFPDNAAKRAQLEDLQLESVCADLRWLKSVLPSALNRDGQDLLAALVASDADAITKQAFMFANEVVFCHNDALSGNILFHDSWDRVQIIDYEYGGYNFRGFDFANHFCEHCGFEMDLRLYPTPEQQFEWFRGYMTVATPELLAQLDANRETKAFFHALYPVVNRYALAAHLFWGFWAVVQAAHSKIDFDFLDYAKKRFTTFQYHRAFFFSDQQQQY